MCKIVIHISVNTSRESSLTLYPITELAFLTKMWSFLALILHTGISVLHAPAYMSRINTDNDYIKKSSSHNF